MQVTIIMPALNEEANIQPAITSTLKAFSDFSLDGEILVVNDGSTDRTEALASELLKKDNRIRILRHDNPAGIGASFWDGVDNALGDAICMLPGDNENDPVEILRYFNLLEKADIINPYVTNKRNRPVLRNFLSFLYQLIINITFFTRLKYTNGTVLYRKSLLEELEHRCKGFFFQTDILIRLIKKGYLFVEVPYSLRKREKGRSKAVNLKSLIEVAKGYLKLVKDIYFSEADTRKAFSDDSVTKKYHNQLARK
ncbi:MAG: hypothetical protein DRP74_05405 [Candidatus Omnitrophota bacterium]|nr:MAG: hypothetical protein DRP74_05405 [Candidatus Omnitrophota bacterium]